MEEKRLKIIFIILYFQLNVLASDCVKLLCAEYVLNFSELPKVVTTAVSKNKKRKQFVEENVESDQSKLKLNFYL